MGLIVEGMRQQAFQMNSLSVVVRQEKLDDVEFTGTFRGT